MDDLVERGTECADVMKAFFSACPDPGTILNVVPIGEDDPVPPALSSEEWDILRRVNGRKTVLHFLRESKQPLHLAVCHLLGLVKEGYVRTSVPEGCGESDAEEGAPGTTGKRPKRLLRVFRGSRDEDETPRDPVGRLCLLANRFLDLAGISGEGFRQTWGEIQRIHPLASLLAVAEDGFSPSQFATEVEAWGRHADDWQDVEHEIREALQALVSRLYRNLFLKEGKKRADAVLRRVLQEMPEEDEMSSLANLQESLPAA
jgi:hypothetical protein